MHLQEHNVYVWQCCSWIYLSNVNKQHKYEFGITFSFIIVRAPKCQPGHNLHPINIFTSIIPLLIPLKYGVKVKQNLVEILFFYRFYFYWHFRKKGIRSQEGRGEINNPHRNRGRGQEKKKKKVIFSFICWRKGFAVSSPSKTRIKGTGKKINDIVTEVLSLSPAMIFELYWWIVIRYFSLAALLSVMNAYHLVLDDSVTDRGLKREGKLVEEGGVGGLRESERKPLSNWKAGRL